MSTRVASLVFVVTLMVVCTLYSQDPGQIEGTVRGVGGERLSNVIVEIRDREERAETDTKGEYVIEGIPPGSYIVTFTKETYSEERRATVQGGEPFILNPILDVRSRVGEGTIVGATRRPQPKIMAPSSTTAILRDEIHAQVPHGQLPRLFGFASGVEMVQASPYDFSLNSRGLNPGGPLNNRILVLIDGRDASLPALGAMDWPSLPFSLDELSAAEFVRGPVAAVYGAGAFNGIINLTTTPPSWRQSGKARLSLGELDTRRFEARHAGKLSEGWWYKVNGGVQEAGSFTENRDVQLEPEYGGLNCEAGPMPDRPLCETMSLIDADGELAFANLSVERQFSSDSTLIFEVGTADYKNQTFFINGGRLNADEERPWARLSLDSEHWNLLTFFNDRSAKDTLAIFGGPIFVESSNFGLDLVGNRGFAGRRGELNGGLAVSDRDASSIGPDGEETLFSRGRTEGRQAVFGHLEYELGKRATGTLSARWDRSDFFDARTSFRGTLLFSLPGRSVLRVSGGNAFKTPTFADFFFQVPVMDAVEIDDAATRGILGVQGIPFLLVGQEDLQVEEIESFEVEYRGRWGKKVFASVGYYDNSIENLVKDIRVSDANRGLLFEKFVFPAENGLTPAQIDALRTQLDALGLDLFESLSVGTDGNPIIPVFSFANVGSADTSGLEVDLEVSLSEAWRLDFNYNHLEFEPHVDVPGARVEANAPENRFALGVSYLGKRLSGLLRYRWVDDYDWVLGPFRGSVESYNVTDFSLSYRVNQRLDLGLDVSNVLDERHFETYGGDVLGRRGLGYVAVSW